MKIALLGVTGPSGKELIAEALSRGHQLSIYARNPSKLEESLRNNPAITIFQGEFEDEKSLRKVFQGQDAVLSTLSAYFNQQTNHVLTDAYKLIFTAMKAEGVLRFIGTGTPSYIHKKDRFNLFFWILVTLLRLINSNVYHDVVGCTSIVAEEQTVQWSWLRIMSANNKQRTKKVLFGYLSDGRMTFGAIRRADLADVMLDELIEDKWVGQMPIIRSV